MAEVPAKLALPAPRAERISLLVARSAAFIVCVMGGVVLLGWQIPDPELSQALPGLANMTPHAAVGILAAGNIPDDAHHGHAVQERLANAGQGVGKSRAGHHEDHAWIAGAPRVAISHAGGGEFMRDQ